MASIIYDLETTGLIVKGAPADRQPRITEIGAILVDNGKIIDEYSQLINPECEIPRDVQKKTGITDDMVKGQPIFRDVVGDLQAFFDSAQSVWGHNVYYDINVTQFNMQLMAMEPFRFPETVRDTVKEFQHVTGKWIKLGDLYKMVVGEDMPNAHRAVDDCRGLYRILEKEGVLCLL